MGSTMTDPNYTAMLLVIDRSGSMAGIRDDMVGGLTTMLAEQAVEPGLLTVDIVTFDTEIEIQCSLADPKDVTVTLEPRGRTALFDAITGRDYAVVQGFTVVIALGYVIVNLLVDLSYAYLDPRIRVK